MKVETLTTHNVAAICNVHHTTVINWVKEGKLDAYTTPGGHRRITRENLLKFIKEYDIPTTESFSVRKKVLIVDDDVEALEELQEILSDLGIDIDLASDGFEVGRMVYLRKPDLILLDFKMPRMNGFEVCKVLKDDPETAPIPIIAITALRNPGDSERIMECGVAEYLPKPVDIPHLIDVVKKHLGIRAVERKIGAL